MSEGDENWYRKQHPITKPLLAGDIDADKLSAQTKAEMQAGQEIVARLFLERTFGGKK